MISDLSFLKSFRFYDHLHLFSPFWEMPKAEGAYSVRNDSTGFAIAALIA